MKSGRLGDTSGLGEWIIRNQAAVPEIGRTLQFAGQADPLGRLDFPELPASDMGDANTGTSSCSGAAGRLSSDRTIHGGPVRKGRLGEPNDPAHLRPTSPRRFAMRPVAINRIPKNVDASRSQDPPRTSEVTNEPVSRRPSPHTSQRRLGAPARHPLR